MSYRITNKIRTEFLDNILKESFKDRFDTLIHKMGVMASKKIRDEHPAFFEGRKDPKLKPYLIDSEGIEVYLDRVPARLPYSWGSCDHELYGQRHVTRENKLKNISVSVTHPWGHHERLDISGTDLEKEYHALWREFSEAKTTLFSTVYAYNNYDKFKEDFPTLAKHMPAPVKKVGTAVAVQVGDVMKKLASVGIPPSVKEEA